MFMICKLIYELNITKKNLLRINFISNNNNFTQLLQKLLNLSLFITICLPMRKEVEIHKFTCYIYYYRQKVY